MGTLVLMPEELYAVYLAARLEGCDAKELKVDMERKLPADAEPRASLEAGVAYDMGAAWRRIATPEEFWTIKSMAEVVAEVERCFAPAKDGGA